MALSNTIEQQTGVKVDYWKIDAVELRREQGKLVIRMNGYLSKTARDSGKKVAAQTRVILPLPDEKSIADMFAYAYEQVTKPVPDEEGNETNKWAKSKQV